MKLKAGIFASVVALVITIALSVSALGAGGFITPSGTTQQAAGPVPPLVNYQGYLTDAGNQPLTGSYQVVFAIYDVPVAGAPLWSETHSAVTVTNGLFHVLLGSNTPFPPNVFGGNTYLGVRVGADAEMTPRQQMVSVPYALRAQTADSAQTVDGIAASDLSIRAELSTAGAINSPGNPVDWTKLKNVPSGLADGVDETGTGGGSLSEAKQLVASFIVASGESVTAGDVVSFLDGHIRKGLFQGADITATSESIFKAAATRGLDAAVLSSTKFVLAYKDGASFINRAIVGEISGDNITYGPEATVGTSGTSFNNLPPSVAALSSTKFVVVYEDEGNANRGTARIGDVSGTTITLGSQHVFTAEETFDEQTSVAALSSTKFVVVYDDGSSPSAGTAIVGDVSGNSIAFGPEAIFGPGPLGTYQNVVTPLSSTRFVAAYQADGQGKAIVGTVSGNAIAYGPAAVFNPATTNSISAAALSSTRFVLTYDDRGNGAKGTAIVGIVSGDAIAFGPESVFHSVISPDWVGRTSAAAIAPTKFVVAYNHNASDINASYGGMLIGNVNGDSITYGNEFVFDQSARWFLSAVTLSLNEFAVAYVDMANNQYGTVRIGRANDEGNMVGIAKQSGPGGETVPVIVGGVSDVHSGLTAGTTYYATRLGDLTAEITDYKQGLAISPTEILLGSR